MKMPRWVPCLVAGMALGFAYLAWQASHEPDSAAYVEKAKYDAAVKQGEEKINAALAVIEQKDRVIAAKDKDLAAREAKIGDLNKAAAANVLERDALAKETAVLKSNAAEAIAANPAVKVLVENYDLRIAAYDRQVFTLTRTIEEERAAKADWKAKFEEKDGQYKELKNAFDIEKGLRLSCESANKKLMPKKWQKWARWGGCALAFAVGNLAHR